MKVFPRILISYWSYRSRDIPSIVSLFPMYSSQLDVFIDSGAYSAWNSGVSIDVHEYANWIQCAGMGSVYANLDVIGDPKGSYRNQRILEDTYGLSPIPVFHPNEDWKWLRMYLKSNDYIALGGISQERSPEMLMPWAIRAFQLGSEFGTRFHGFAVTAWTLLKALPWYSCDSSTWINGVKWGTVRIFDFEGGAFRHIILGDRDMCKSAKKSFDALGYNWSKFAHKEAIVTNDVLGISALSTMVAERWLALRHSSSGHNGPKLYLVDGGSQYALKAFNSICSIGGDFKWMLL